jgi:hypothetical protein
MRTLRSWCAVGVTLALCGATAASAQVLMQPTEPPAESAALAPWFVADAPVVWNGIAFHQAGAQVFFDGQRMVRVGWFEGTPLYVDTTIEPNSIVLVPVGGRMLQPFERVRDREVAGTTGSHAPSFPVRPATTSSAWGSGAGEPRLAWGLSGMAMAAGPPIAWQAAPYESLLGRMVSEWPEREEPVEVGVPRKPVPEPGPVGTVGTPALAAPAPLFVPGAIGTVRQADETLGVWVDYEGTRWQACGSAEVLAPEVFSKTGDYRGFPVYSRQGAALADRIYLPSRAGFVAPYTRGPVERKPSGACVPATVG